MEAAKDQVIINVNCIKSKILDNTGNNLGNKRTLTIKAKLHAYNMRTQKKRNLVRENF